MFEKLPTPARCVNMDLSPFIPHEIGNSPGVVSAAMIVVAIEGDDPTYDEGRFAELMHATSSLDGAFECQLDGISFKVRVVQQS